MKKLLLLLLCLLPFSKGKAQVELVTQSISNFSRLNPAAAGILYQPVISGVSRLEEGDFAYKTYTLSYEQYLKFLRGGIGLRIQRFDDGLYINNTSAAAQYTHMFSLSPDFHLSLGAEFSYVKRYLNAPGYNVGWTSFPGFSATKYYPNTAIGLLGSYKRAYFGFATHNLFRPVISFTGNSDNRLPRQYIFQCGGFAPISSDKEKGALLHLGLSYTWINFDYYHYNNYTFETELSIWIFSAGLSLRVYEYSTLCPIIGIHAGRFKAGYSYDKDMSGFFWPRNTHEFTLLVFLGKKPASDAKNLHPLAGAIRRMF